MRRADSKGRPDSGQGAKPGICLLTETYHPVVGGGETQARALAEALVARGWPVRILTRRSDTASPRRERLAGVEITRVLPTGSRHLNKWALIVTTLPELIRSRHHYELLLVSGFRILGIPALLNSLVLRKKCLIKADSLGEMSGDYFAAGLSKLRLRPSFPPFRLFISLRNRLLRKAHAFVAVSSPIAVELRQAGVKPEAIVRIPNCVDTRLFRPVVSEKKRVLRARLGLPAERRIAVFTGRLVSYKGLPLLVRVWRQIQPDYPDALLALVGGGGMDIHNCEDELRDYVRRHDLADSVLFCGEVSNVHEYLQAADLFVFPTENEAFGVSLIEAMACGLPAISTTEGGIADILRHEQNGLAVPVGDSRRLRIAIQRLLSDAALGQRLGKAARRNAVEEYSVDRTTELYAGLAECLLGLDESRGGIAGTSVQTMSAESREPRSP